MTRGKLRASRGSGSCSNALRKPSSYPAQPPSPAESARVPSRGPRGLLPSARCQALSWGPSEPRPRQASPGISFCWRGARHVCFQEPAAAFSRGPHMKGLQSETWRCVNRRGRSALGETIPRAGSRPAWRRRIPESAPAAEPGLRPSPARTPLLHRGPPCAAGAKGLACERLLPHLPPNHLEPAGTGLERGQGRARRREGRGRLPSEGCLRLQAGILGWRPVELSTPF